MSSSYRDIMHVISPESGFASHKHGLISRHSFPIITRSKAVGNGTLVGDFVFLLFYGKGFGACSCSARVGRQPSCSNLGP